MAGEDNGTTGLGAVRDIVVVETVEIPTKQTKLVITEL